MPIQGNPEEGRKLKTKWFKHVRLLTKKQMTTNYKASEKTLKQINKRKVAPQDKKDRLQVVRSAGQCWPPASANVSKW